MSSAKINVSVASDLKRHHSVQFPSNDLPLEAARGRPAIWLL